MLTLSFATLKPWIQGHSLNSFSVTRRSQREGVLLSRSFVALSLVARKPIKLSLPNRPVIAPAHWPYIPPPLTHLRDSNESG